jgi:hypothetical protein
MIWPLRGNGVVGLRVFLGLILDFFCLSVVNLFVSALPLIPPWVLFYSLLFLYYCFASFTLSVFFLIFLILLILLFTLPLLLRLFFP